MIKIAINDNIKTAVIAVSVLTLLAKLFGFAEKIVLAYFFGTSEITDVYFSSLAFFMSAVFIAKELLSPTLVPNLVKAIKESEKDASDLFRIFSYILLLLGVIISFLFYAFSGRISGIIAPGFSLDTRQMQSDFIQACVPYFGISMVSIIFIFTLQAHKRFLQASAVEVLYKLVLLVLLTVLASGMGIRAISLALCGSSLLSLMMMYVVTPSRGVIFSKTTVKLNSYFGKTVSLMPPIVIGVVFSHISGLIDNMFASTFPEGSLSQLSFAKKLIDTIILLGPIAIITVLYPNLAQYHENSRKFKFLLNRSLRVVLFVAVPLTFILLFSGRNMIAIVFQHGSFSDASTSSTFAAFSVYSFGLIALACEPIIVHAYFAKMDIKTPIKWGIICVLLNILLTFIFIKIFGFIGIPLAFVISKTLKVLILSVVFERQRKAVISMARYVAKLSLVSSLAFLFVLPIDFPDFERIILGRILAVLVRSGVFLSIYLLLTYKIFKIYESRHIFQTLAILRGRNAAR